jgi:hypothetical protein
MRQRLAVLLAIALAFFVGMAVNARRAHAEGDGLVHVYTIQNLRDKGQVQGRVVAAACESGVPGNIPTIGPSVGRCWVVTQEQ